MWKLLSWPAMAVLALSLATLQGTPALAQSAASFEAEALKLINQYRPQNGRSALAPHPQLYEIARRHSETMAASGSFSHNGFRSRFRQSGFRRCHENLAWNHATPAALLAAWQRSPGHNRTLLHPRLRYVGLARAGRYVTLIACG